jgi:hypothetical protein
MMHKKIIRVVGGAKYDAHTAPILRTLDMLKLDDIYRVQSCKYIYKYICGLLPPPISNIFRLAQDTHLHSTRQSTAYKLNTYKARTLVASQAIVNMGPKLWNCISPILYLYNGNLVSIQTFSKILKSQIIACYE